MKFVFPTTPFMLMILLMAATATTTMSFGNALLLQGKNILVTGGGRGIGRAIALICHDQGANVFITARTQSDLEETVSLANYSGDEQEEETTTKTRLQQSAMAAKLLARRGTAARGRSPSGKSTSVGARRTGSASKARSSQSSVSQLVDAVKTGSSTTTAKAANNSHNNPQERMAYYLCDVTNESQVESTIQRILEEHSTIDILINNAGGSQSPKGPIGTLESQKLEELLKLNVVGPQLVTSAICKHSWNNDDDSPNEEKVVLNISSKAGKVGLVNMSFYVASKFALEGLTSSWAKELKPKTVRVHSLSPGMVNTKSFPKPPGKAGVREASSIRDVLMLILTGKLDEETTVVDNMMEYTGHYIHVDEYDQVVAEMGVQEGHLAFKAIDEEAFRV